MISTILQKIRLKLSHKLVLGSVLASLLFLVIASQIVIPSSVRGSISTRDVSFQLQEDVQNFFSLEANCHNIDYSVSGIVGVKYMEAALDIADHKNKKNEPLKFGTTVPGDRINLKNSCISLFDIAKGTKLDLKITKDNIISIVISGNTNKIIFSVLGDGAEVKCGAYAGANVALIYSCKEGEIIKLRPGKYEILYEPGEATLRLKLNSGIALLEEDALQVREFDTNYYSNSMSHSSIISAEFVGYTLDKPIAFGRRTILRIGKGELVRIGEISAVDGNFNIIFSSKLSELSVNEARTDLTPNITEYLSKNNIIIVVINLVLAVSAFVFSLAKEVIYEND